MDPDKWFAQYDEKLQAAAASANKAEQALRDVGGSATSKDGEVTVTVTAGGALSDLVLRPGVRDLEPEQLARVIIETRQYAKRQRTWFRHQLPKGDVTVVDPTDAGCLETAERWWEGSPP